MQSIYKVRKFKRDISWANDPITITRINEHPHSANGPPSLLGSITMGFLRVLGLHLHYLQNNTILQKIKFYIKLNGTRAIFNFTTHNKIRPMICTIHQHTRKSHSTKTRSHLNIHAWTHGKYDFNYVHSHYEKSCFRF